MLTVNQLLDEAEVFMNAGRAGRAESGARLALREEPTNTRAMVLLANAISAFGDRREALRLYHDAVLIGTELYWPYKAIADDYRRRGQLAEAESAYRKWIAAAPHSASAHHMLGTTLGSDAPSRCSVAYVSELFNNFALRFDADLQRLGYRGPEAVATAIERWRHGDGRTLDVLDAGCGTGLCGAAVRRHCMKLTGVDLAAKMLSLARKRACYDELVESELDEFLASRRDSFDAIVSADVLIYFGDLSTTLELAHHALKPSGLLIFTVEALLTEGNDSYQLTPTGRYAHRDSYLKSALQQHGFKVKGFRSEPLRYEDGKAVVCHIVVARKPKTGSGVALLRPGRRFRFRIRRDAPRSLT